MARSYAQFCPAARTLDVLGERWTMLILRELLAGPMRWSDLDDALPGLGPTLLSQRLRDLEHAGYVGRRELPPPAARTVYELTELGRQAEPVLMAIGRLGVRYLDEPTDEQPFLDRIARFGLKSMLALEALTERELSIGLELEEMTATIRIGERRDESGRLRRFHERVEVSDRMDDTADVLVSGSIGVLVWHQQGLLTTEQALAELDVRGDDDHVAHAFELLGLT
ncbi:MAG: helix-turn-helix domain-containing protein [Actinomycetota bacterium]